MTEALATPPQKQLAADKTSLITGSEAIAVACKLADVDVITAYPIRPYDTVMQYVAKLVSNGELDCEYIVAESEHSQFEIVKHASAVGARVFCGSSGVGLDVRLRGADRDAGAAHSHGGHGGEPRARRPGRIRRGA